MYTLGIEAFLAIIEKGSISKASEILHLSQSSVSHRLKNLESELGFKLINRQPGIRGITLTKRGHAFISIAEKTLLLEKEVESIRNLRRKTPITIGVADSISQYLLPALYKELLTEPYHIQPRIITQHTLETYESIKSGDIDIGFVKRDFNMPNVVVSKVFDEDMVLVRYGQTCNFDVPINPEELKSNDEIFMDWGYCYQIWHDSLWKENSFKIQVDAAHLIFELIDNEDQWSIVPRSVFDALKNTGPFYEQQLASIPPKRTCYLVKNKYISHSKKSIINFFEEYFTNKFRGV